MITKPIIGITCDYEVIERKYGYSSEYNTLHYKYVAAVEKSGGVPLLIPALSGHNDNHEIIRMLDAVILTGGDDISPSLYNEKPLPSTNPMNPKRETHEIAFATELMKSKLPFLAICGGMQIVNVVRGGSLVQDIPSQVGDKQSHWMLNNSGFHEVGIARNSLLEKIADSDKIVTNSMHHQAVKTPGKGLRVVAHSTADNVIEAFEAEDRDFGLGVQWHPEEIFDMMPHSMFFKALIDATK